MKKKLIIIKASNDICGSELDHLRNIADMFQMAHCTFEMKTLEEFKQSKCAQDKYDYLYLAAHADPEYFGTRDGTVSIKWEEFAFSLCETVCLNEECILLLGCCRGGLKGVAQILFYSCDKIDYVCGPRWTVTSHDIAAGFHTFVYNMIVRKEQPSKAAERASHATGYDFFCYDRVEFEDEYRTLISAISKQSDNT
ncbi:MAG: hypothetical protein ACYS1A_01630 [Planctomycetota bacterium]|jgi:hypothetical protein